MHVPHAHYAQNGWPTRMPGRGLASCLELCCLLDTDHMPWNGAVPVSSLAQGAGCTGPQSVLARSSGTRWTADDADLACRFKQSVMVGASALPT